MELVSAASAPPVPEPHEVLDAVAAAGTVRRDQDERGFHAAKREVVLALERAPLLIAVRDRRPVCEPGPTGGVMIAFTDAEAAAAWEQVRHPAAPDAQLTRSAELNRDGAPGRRVWLRWFDALGAGSVAVNPAGPLGTVVHADEVRTMRPSPLRRRGPSAPAHPWLDARARAAERARVQERLAVFETALQTGDQRTIIRLRQELSELNRMGGLILAATLQFLSGRQWLQDGSAEKGLYQMIYGSFGWARFGDPYRATDGLIEAAAELSRFAGERWQTAFHSELCTVLERIRTGYRSDDVARVFAAERGAR